MVNNLVIKSLCSSRKNPSPLQGVIGNSKGEQVLKAKILKAKCKAKLKFLGGIRGGIVKQKTFRERSMDIFWNYTLHDVQCGNVLKTQGQNLKKLDNPF